MLNVLFLNSVVFTYFCLQPSELHKVLIIFFNFPPDFLTEKIWNRLVFVIIKYFILFYDNRIVCMYEINIYFPLYFNWKFLVSDYILTKSVFCYVAYQFLGQSAD
jgi:hypothetical protein